MSRIDVVPADKGKFKVLVNFVQHGVPYTTAALANQEAKKVLDIMPSAMIRYAKED